MSPVEKSTMAEHILKKKEGLIVTPFNNSIGHLLEFTSWTKQRLPEYLWLALVLDAMGRKAGLVAATKMIEKIVRIFPTAPTVRFSQIMSLPIERQYEYLQIVAEHIPPEVLNPLTSIYSIERFPALNEMFGTIESMFENRVETIAKVTEACYDHQSHEATDVRYLALLPLIISGRIKFPEGRDEVVEPIKYYASLEHSDPRMRGYRPAIRSLEGGGFLEDTTFDGSGFWTSVSRLTNCRMFVVDFEETKLDHSVELSAMTDRFENFYLADVEKTAGKPRVEVLLGTLSYSLKIFREILNLGSGQTISGRLAFRTLVEVYVMVKYLLQKESDDPKIWSTYQLYGAGKYKQVLLKQREIAPEQKSHIAAPLLEHFVNEIRWEEFVDVDLKNFDRVGIREKCILVGEKDLYDLYYEYETSFSHGLWGAIRESALITCDNAVHQYHKVPDTGAAQKLTDVTDDAIIILRSQFEMTMRTLGERQ